MNSNRASAELGQTRCRTLAQCLKKRTPAANQQNHNTTPAELSANRQDPNILAESQQHPFKASGQKTSIRSKQSRKHPRETAAEART